MNASERQRLDAELLALRAVCEIERADSAIEDSYDLLHDGVRIARVVFGGKGELRGWYGTPFEGVAFPTTRGPLAELAPLAMHLFMDARIGLPARCVMCSTAEELWHLDLDFLPPRIRGELVQGQLALCDRCRASELHIPPGAPMKASDRWRAR